MSGRVAIIGLGASGRACAEALQKRGVTVCGFAQAPADVSFPTHISAAGDALAKAVKEWSPDYAVISPGIAATSRLVRELQSSGIELKSEVELAWDLQEAGADRGRPWLCVTGTNGKTTSVGLTTAILEACGYKVAEVGNVGLPISSQVDSDADIFVVELSSFQLEYAQNMAPLAAICLNIDADHLDWHGSARAYRDAKMKIYERVTGARFYFEDQEQVREALLERPDLVERATALSVAEEEDYSWVPFYQDRGRPKALLDDIRAAVALAKAAGADGACIRRGLESFAPSAHRLQTVGIWDGIRFVDDSKATNAHAAAAALRALPEARAIWIGGGDAKGQSFEDLVRKVRRNLKAVILIGKNASGLQEALDREAPEVPVTRIHGAEVPTSWMSEVVDRAASLASSGDTVILSPACASWDQFTSYAQRGKIFAEAVASHYQSERQKT